MMTTGTRTVSGRRYLPVGSSPTKNQGVLGSDGKPAQESLKRQEIAGTLKPQQKSAPSMSTQEMARSLGDQKRIIDNPRSVVSKSGKEYVVAGSDRTFRKQKDAIDFARQDAERKATESATRLRERYSKDIKDGVDVTSVFTIPSSRSDVASSRRATLRFSDGRTETWNVSQAGKSYAESRAIHGNVKAPFLEFKHLGEREYAYPDL